MRLEDYWQVEGAIERNESLVRLFDRLQYDSAFDRKTILAIRRRVAGLLGELEKLREVWNKQMEGQSNQKA